MNQPASPNPSLSRRTLVGVAAWTAPAIALTVASPAAAASVPAANALTLDANVQVPANATFDVTAALVRATGSLTGHTVVFGAATGTFTFPSGASALTDGTGQATVAAKAPSAIGTYTITATIPALNVTATILIEVTALGLYTTGYSPASWQMSNIGLSGAQQLAVGSGYYWALQNGVAYMIDAGDPKNRWKTVAAPGKIEEIVVHPSNGSIAAAVGAGGAFYQMYGGSTFVATPGAGKVVQASAGSDRWYVRTAAGDVYWNLFTKTGTSAAWTKLDGVTGALDIQAYPYAAHWIIAIGPDRLAYVHYGALTASSTFKQYVQGVTAGTTAKQVAVSANRWQMLGEDGNYYTASINTGAWQHRPAPVKLVSFDAYLPNSTYVHALGEDGNPYQIDAANTTSFVRKLGTPDGEVVDVAVGSSTWTARTASGDVYLNIGGSPTGPFKLIPGAAGFTKHTSYEHGSYIIGVAPVN